MRHVYRSPIVSELADGLWLVTVMNLVRQLEEKAKAQEKNGE